MQRICLCVCAQAIAQGRDFTKLLFESGLTGDALNALVISSTAAAQVRVRLALGLLASRRQALRVRGCCLLVPVAGRLQGLRGCKALAAGCLQGPSGCER